MDVVCWHRVITVGTDQPPRHAKERRAEHGERGGPGVGVGGERVLYVAPPWQTMGRGGDRVVVVVMLLHVARTCAAAMLSE